jgi:hypothetical protein
MLEGQWSALLQQHDNDGLIWLDAEEHVRQANLKGQEYLALLAQASVGDALTHLGERSFQELIALIPSPPTVEMYHEVVLAGSVYQVFEVVIQSVLTGARFEGWILVIRQVNQGQPEQTLLESQERPTLIAHWPPVSPLTSNLS